MNVGLYVSSIMLFIFRVENEFEMYLRLFVLVGSIHIVIGVFETDLAAYWGRVQPLNLYSDEIFE